MNIKQKEISMNWFYRVVVLVCFTTSIFAAEPQWRFRPVEPEFVVDERNSDYSNILIAETGEITTLTSFGGNQKVISQLDSLADQQPINHAISAGDRVDMLSFPEGQLLHSSIGAIFVNKLGKIVWERNGEVRLPTALAGNKLVFGSDESIVCIDLLSGNVLWSKDLNLEFPELRSPLFYGATTDGANVYFSINFYNNENAERAGVLIKLDAPNGVTVWVRKSKFEFWSQLEFDSEVIAATVSITNSNEKRFATFNKLTGLIRSEIPIGPINFAKLFQVAPGSFLIQTYGINFPYQTNFLLIKNETILWRKNLVSENRFQTIVGVNELEFIAIEYPATDGIQAKIEKRSIVNGSIVWSAPVFQGFSGYSPIVSTRVVGNVLTTATEWRSSGDFGFLIAEIDLTSGVAISSTSVPQKRATQPSASYATNATLLVGAAVNEITGKLVVRAVNKVTGASVWTNEWPVPLGTSVPSFLGENDAIIINENMVAVVESHGDTESYVTVLDIASGALKYKSDRSFAKSMIINAGNIGSLHRIKPCPTCAYESRFVDISGSISWVNSTFPNAEPLNNDLFFFDENNRAFALSEQTGARLWQAKISDAFILAAQAVNGGLYYISSRGQLTRVDPVSGAILWTKIFSPLDTQSRISFIKGIGAESLFVRLRSGSGLMTIFKIQAASGIVESQHSFSSEIPGFAISPIGETYFQAFRKYSSYTNLGDRKSLAILTVDPLDSRPVGENLLFSQRPLVLQRKLVGEAMLAADVDGFLALRQEGYTNEFQGQNAFGGVVERHALPANSIMSDLVLRAVSQGFNSQNNVSETLLEVENRSNFPALNVRLFSLGFAFKDQILACSTVSSPCGITLPRTAEVFFDVPANSKIRFSVLGERVEYGIEQDYAYRDVSHSDNRVETYNTSLTNGFE
jgi:outer membrane protein assembly factor BamB